MKHRQAPTHIQERQGEERSTTTHRKRRLGFIGLILMASTLAIISSLGIPYFNQLRHALINDTWLPAPQGTTHGVGFTLPAHNAASTQSVTVPGHGLPGTGKTVTPSATVGIPIGQKTPLVPAPTNTSANNGVSPLLFGTNLGLFDSSDQVVTSATTRALLQQMHTKIIRMPLRTNLPEALEVQAAQTIQSMGAAPLIVLAGPLSANSLALDTTLINDMNRVFGNQVVYYEFDNEPDLHAIDVARYTASWNSIVPQLKQLATNGRFIGPVTYHYDANYLYNFLINARPKPDLISWHEYTCHTDWAQSICLANINNWNTHIQDANRIILLTLHTQTPIMITEWNYSPNAHLNDGKNNDNNFMTTWTQAAIQTLAANHVFASMQYSCTNTVIPLVDASGAPTTQGMAFKAMYESLIGLR